MKEILITSSVLILALLALRGLFRKTISRRAQYALWALVLLRLLVPLNLPAAEHSVLTAAEPVMRDLENQAVYLRPDRETITAPQGTEAPYPYEAGGAFAVGPASHDNIYHYTDRHEVSHDVAYAHQIALEDILRPVWYAGMLAVGLWFLFSNYIFWQKLWNRRVPYPVEQCRYPVYLVESCLPSPCLFGLFRPAVYLTPAAVSTPESLRHVLAHETTHARHGDLLWSLLRCVCLTVYWFDPLVWIAAAVSKTDCELACDEGALGQLEAGERIAYGRTLLSLIPVRRTPGNPLLSATTMTAGKRQLKDRITRIAENRRNRTAALLAVLVLAAAACAVTFTGAASRPAETRADGPLTGEELRYFNETFFNGGFNIHNQFLSSTYETPEDIDLYELFYCGTGLPGGAGGEERQAVVDVLGFDADTDLTKCPAGEMDQVLRENTGLTLEETHQVGLEGFTYLEQYDAYYLFHGDTNYRYDVQITAGERKDGLIRLYYEDLFLADGWKCVTLRETEGGGYHFLSHLPCDKPAIPTVYPAGDPVLVIPLTDLTPYEPQTVPVEHRSYDDVSWVVDRFSLNETGMDDPEDAKQVLLYYSADGVFRAALENQTLDSFLEIEYDTSAGQISSQSFTDLCGRTGFSITYPAATGTCCTAWYSLDADGNPLLLVNDAGTEGTADLDGDGQDELTWVPLGYSGEFYFLLFQREGRLYRAELQQLLFDAWPELYWWDYAILDTDSRCIQVSGSVNMPEWGENARASFTRWIYFDGENLRVYAELPETVDHAAANLSDSIPEEVRAEALKQAQASCEEFLGNDWTGGSGVYDDWRLSELSLVNTYEEFPVGTVEVYRFAWQAHAAKPTEAVLAGGMYLQEDGWMGGANASASPYLVYRVRENGRRQQLESLLTFDYAPDSIAYRADLCRTILHSGLVTPEAFSGEDLYYLFAMDSVSCLNDLAEFPQDEQTLAFQRLAEYSRYEAPLTRDGELFSADFPGSLQGNPGLTSGGAQALQLLLDALNGSTAEEGPADAWAQHVLAEILSSGQVSMELTGVSRGGGRYDTDPALGNGPNRALYFGDFLWSWAEASQPDGPSLTVASQDGTRALTFWQDSGLVRCVRLDRTLWLRAESPDDPADVFSQDIFSFMRVWYDETEFDALSGGILIPDRGQSHLEIAQEWSERAAGVGLLVTPGSKYACTFVKTTADVDGWTHLPEDLYPEQSAGKERFWFSYTRAFVPENQQALNYQMAGNTGSYTGSDPSVPEGAYENYQMGVLYLSDQGWRCDATGTGP